MIEAVIYAVILLFFFGWKMLYDIFYKFVDWFRKGSCIDFLREHGGSVVLWIIGIRLSYIIVSDSVNFLVYMMQLKDDFMCWEPTLMLKRITWDPTTTMAIIPPYNSVFWNILMFMMQIAQWCRLSTLSVLYHAQQPGSGFSIAPQPTTQVRIKTITLKGEVAYGVGVAIKWSGRVFIVTAKHILRNAVLIQAGKDGFWTDLPTTWRTIHNDGVAWEVEASLTSKLGVKLASVGEIIGQMAVTTVSTDLKQSSGIIYKLDRVVCYTGSTEPGFSGAPYLAGSRVYGIHIGESNGKNIGFNLYDAISRIDSPEITEESKLGAVGTETKAVHKDYYTSGRYAPVKVSKSETSTIAKALARDTLAGVDDWADVDAGAWKFGGCYEQRMTTLESKVDNMIDLVTRNIGKAVPEEQSTGSSQIKGTDFQQGPQSTTVTHQARRAPMNGSINVPNSSLSVKPKNSSQSQLSKSQKRRLLQKSKLRDLEMQLKHTQSMGNQALGQQQKLAP
uniref:Peptidase S39 domain-containing protein n=1 Tax=Crocidura shantungensis ribovirus 16 TaxID=3139536 RepID=A0AB38ZK26_9VIRU